MNATAPSEEVEQPKAANENVIVDEGRASNELMRQIAIGPLRGVVAHVKAKLEAAAGVSTAVAAPQPPTSDESDKEVMTADEVAEFLGVDRNTVYDYAGRGVIPHQRLGKRILFCRGALVSWLESSCKATSTRKG